ncbi:MAG: helix-turn-helix transcriptional regulator, partial [Solirubrobacterales bacterium]
MPPPPLPKMGPPANASTILPMDWRGSIVSSMGRRIAARLAENLRHLREARSLTQEQVARLAGIPRATWGHLETGAANPT